MVKEKKYVPNDVFEFTCTLKYGLGVIEETIYTKPFPNGKKLEECEEIVERHYFTKEKIKELKEQLIDRIQKCNNPFDIYCSDFDGDYNVTEEQLFKFDEE